MDYPAAPAREKEMLFMDFADKPDGKVMDDLPAVEPRIKDGGMSADEIGYMTGGVKLAEPSFISTNSKYLNSPLYRDTFAQIALHRNGHDAPVTYVIPMAAKAIGEVTDFAEFARLVEEEKRLKPEFAEWLAARRHKIFRVDELKDHSPGTLGHTIWNFLVSTGYQMDMLQMGNITVTNDIDYISQRRGAIHDLEHLVSGFGTNWVGEIGLLWTSITSFVNYFSPDLAQHIAAGQTLLAHAAMQQTSLHYPKVFPTLIEAVRSGMAMGGALKKPMMMEDWESMLDLQLSDIAKRLGITPAPGAAWDWTNEATMG
jgi:ubiquinone biosynthesis protein Coq4